MKRKVALIVETSTVYGRDVLAGIVRSMRMHDQWSVFFEQRDLRKKPPAWLTNWRGDGIISRVTTPDLIEAVERTGVALVELTDRHYESDLPLVRSDHAAIGELGAKHFLERGFQRFGYCGFTGEAWSLRRQDAFVSAVQHSGALCDVYNSPWHGPAARSWEREQDCLTKWLLQFTPEFAVRAGNDIRGQHVLDACSRARLTVPVQAVVLGVDNDELLCRICSLPLSSVIPNAQSVGFRATELLPS